MIGRVTCGDERRQVLRLRSRNAAFGKDAS